MARHLLLPLRLVSCWLLLAAWFRIASAQEDMQDGCVHMQIIHSTNQAYFTKRAVEFNLANRSDVAYYAKRTYLSVRLPGSQGHS